MKTLFRRVMITHLLTLASESLLWSAPRQRCRIPRGSAMAKMNMIMHGDGHGGIYHHDGLVDLGGVFPEQIS